MSRKRLAFLPKDRRSFFALICSISRRWRDVAIEASDLWTTIYIHDQKHIPAAELFLERSKIQLLDVDVEVGVDFRAFGYDADTLRVAELTSAHLERTRTLSLSVSTVREAKCFSTLYQPMSAPHLVNLSVDDPGWSQGIVPFLESICSFSSNGSDGLHSNRTSISILTRLELTSVHLEHEELQSVFTYFPSLETLILPRFGRKGRLEEDQEDRPIILAPSSLRSLAVHLDYDHVYRYMGDSSYCSCVLGSVHFQNLEYLEVLDENSRHNLYLDNHFKELPRLKTLRLQQCSVPPLDDDFFHSLKLLSHLELVDNLSHKCPLFRKINQLPEEILALIFATGLHALSSDAHLPILASVCSICRHWRDVAIRASELWTTIHIASKRHLPAVEAFLERSKGRLIDVDIEVILYVARRFPSEFTAAREVAIITAVTAPHIFRVRTLTMTLESFVIYNAFSRAYRSTAATNLASLSIHLTNDPFPFTGYPPLFANTKFLCHLDTQGNMLNAVPSRANLTTLDLSNYSPTHADIQNLFDASLRLETFILHGFDRDQPLERYNEDDGAPITITAPATLKSLAVSICYTHSNGTSMCGCVLDKLCIPNLEYLELIGATVDLNVHFKELAKLRTLRLQRCHITSANQFFLSLKEVRRLELVDMSPELDIQHITGISAENFSSLSFPHLSSVLFSTKGEYRESPYQLLQLTEHCVAAGCPRFTLEVEHGRSEEFLNVIESCIQDGRVCIIESECSGGLIKPSAAGLDGDFFWSNHM
ncbi:hypothetical protein IW262DRAFT_1451507 [Armillaria fumosa]|nr:hypothetical protein IW262DRAFT_1451507 [Armillaria fumosa]